jgi:putative flippase GtrA
LKLLFKEASGYGVASAVALAVDVTILWVLVRFFGWDYLIAATVSFLAGANIAYVLSLKLAFKQHRLRNRAAEFISFVAIGTVGLAINVTIISLAVRYVGLAYLAAKCLAAGFTFLFNFVARRQLLFVRSSVV